MEISRNEAYSLLKDWVKNENLIKHMLCTEAAMRAYAKKYRENEEVWGICGLLHDFDYEKYPTYNVAEKIGHPYEGVKELERLGYSKQIIYAILGHALYSGVPRNSNMAKVLFAVDELCGFIVACALIREDKLESLQAKSVVKKLKNKKFAEKVSREDIELGIQELKVGRDEHINFVIQALRVVSKELGF